MKLKDMTWEQKEILKRRFLFELNEKHLYSKVMNKPVGSATFLDICDAGYNVSDEKINDYYGEDFDFEDKYYITLNNEDDD